MYELASLNPTTVDMIRRFGGSTSPEIQWPEEETENDGEDRSTIGPRPIEGPTHGQHGEFVPNIFGFFCLK